MSSQTFDRLAAPWILRRDVEGGFSDHRNDRGGATNFGISIHLMELLPDGNDDGYLDGDINKDGVIDIEDIHALDDDRALDIYYRYFWRPNRCEDLPPAVGLCLFDGLVNHQPNPARRLLQEGLEVLADGKVGPITIGAAHKISPDYFLPNYLSHRARFYTDIVRADTSQSTFLRGWLKRMFLLQQFIMKEIKP
ncbi:MAG: glycosyl hydrolase 108 family protein [Gammaproteobacteria bacterium]